MLDYKEIIIMKKFGQSDTHFAEGDWENIFGLYPHKAVEIAAKYIDVDRLDEFMRETYKLDTQRNKAYEAFERLMDLVELDYSSDAAQKILDILG